MKIVSILKITRFPRLMKMINRLEMRDDSLAVFGILVMTIYLFVYIHIVTCLWYYLIDIEKTWLPFKDTNIGFTDFWE